MIGMFVQAQDGLNMRKTNKDGITRRALPFFVYSAIVYIAGDPSVGFIVELFAFLPLPVL